MSDENLINIAGIIVPILAAVFVYFYRKHTNKPSIFFEEFDKAFVNLNDQLDVANILDVKGKISYRKIIKLHAVMFKRDSFSAGVFRSGDVVVRSPLSIDDFSEGDIVGTFLVTDNVNRRIKDSNTLYKDEIPRALKKNCKMWNRWVKKKDSLPEKSKIDLLSRFHTFFMIIHPFEDGNGRIGRRLLNEQMSYLFDRHIELNIDNKDEYYAAVFNASGGDESMLKKILVSSIKSDQFS